MTEPGVFTAYPLKLCLFGSDFLTVVDRCGRSGEFGLVRLGNRAALRLVHGLTHLARFVVRSSGTGRYQTSDDHILF